MANLVTIQIECFGTKTTKAKAVEDGKDPAQTFAGTAVQANWDEALADVAGAFVQAYGISKDVDPAEWLIAKANKHLADKLRADFHRDGVDPATKALARETAKKLSKLDPDKLAKARAFLAQL